MVSSLVKPICMGSTWGYYHTDDIVQKSTLLYSLTSRDGTEMTKSINHKQAIIISHRSEIIFQ